MTVFRKLYYKLVTLFCLITTFVFLFNIDSFGIGYGIFYIFIGLLCYGSLSIGKEEIDPDKTIRNILLFLGWSFLGFGITAMGIYSLLGTLKDNTLMTVFIILAGLGLILVYIINAIVNFDIYTIISIVLVIAGFIIAGNSNGMVIWVILALASFLASIVLFVLSIIKDIMRD